MDVQPLLSLDEITLRPGMYLPARTIYCLKSFIDGVNSDDQSDIWDYMDGFYDWLLETFNHPSDMGMHCEMKLILHYISHDPYDAFDRFFELVDEFKQGEYELPILRAIRRNPLNYLPQRSIYCLYAYFWGKDHASQNYCEPIDMDNFETWVQDKYEMDTPWHKTILFYSQDEFGALNQFKDLYEEFSSQPNHASDRGDYPMA